MGSRRITPTAPVAAAVVSEPITEPTNTPWFQLLDWYTRGVSFARRPPKMKAEIGTPCGFSNSGEMQGQFFAGAVKRLLGCAPFSSLVWPFQGLPFQSMALVGGFLSKPSHHTVLLSILWQTLVKIVPLMVDFSALGLDFILVPGATPKKPFSGLMAYRRPSGPLRIQAISSPTVQIL